MSRTRVIKKYPNRRLYDSAESRYITLGDVRQLVIADQPFEVIDSRSGENLTRCILLQVIAEQELRGPSLLSEDFLAQVIRSYACTMPALARQRLEQSLTSFRQLQEGEAGSGTEWMAARDAQARDHAER